MSELSDLFKKIEFFASSSEALADDALGELSLSTALIQAHPLGFLALIWWVDSRRALRLHYWNKAFDWHQSDGLDIHDHVFDFTSVVMSGCLTNREYEIIPGEVGANCIYRAEYYSGGSKLVREDVNVAMRLIAEKSHLAPSAYSLLSGVLHRTQLNSDEAVTLLAVRYKSDARDGARVVGPDMGSEIKFPREVASSIARDELLGKLNFLLDRNGFAIPNA